MFVANQPRPGNADVPVGDYSSLFPSSSTFSLLVSPFPRAYPLYFDILAHSFALSFLLSYLESIGSALFVQNHPGWGYPPSSIFIPSQRIPKRELTSNPIRHRALHAIEEKQAAKDD